MMVALSDSGWRRTFADRQTTERIGGSAWFWLGSATPKERGSISVIYTAFLFALSILQSSAVPPPSSCTVSFQGRPLRTEFIGGLFFAHWHLRNGEDLRFYLDTGGNTWFYPEAVPRLGAAVDTMVRNDYKVLSVRMLSSLGDSLILPVPANPAAAGSRGTGR